MSGPHDGHGGVHVSRRPGRSLPLLHREVRGVRHPGQEHDHQGLHPREPQHLRERAAAPAQGLLHRPGGHPPRPGHLLPQHGLRGGRQQVQLPTNLGDDLQCQSLLTDSAYNN